MPGGAGELELKALPEASPSAQPLRQWALSAARVATFVAVTCLGVLAPTMAPEIQQSQPTLHILDQFSGPDSHGSKVAQAARQAGFQGTIQAIPIEATEQDTRGVLSAMEQMNAPQADPQQFLSGLESYAIHKQSGLLNASIHAMRGLSGQGARDSALNISRNQNQAEIVLDAWNFLVMAEFNPQADRALRNAISAFDLDPSKIFHADPSIAGPEALKLQQALVDRIDGALNRSERVQQSKLVYDQAVEQLADRGVSVVVSAGNEGEVVALLQSMAFESQPVPAGAELHIPPNFYDNPLSTETTTTVGAVSFTDASGSQAHVFADSTPSQNVAFFADGSVVLQGASKPGHGTSYSAPAVASGLAKIHAKEPSLAPHKAQGRLEGQLTAPFPGVPKPVVKPDALHRFLSDESA